MTLTQLLRVRLVDVPTQRRSHVMRAGFALNEQRLPVTIDALMTRTNARVLQRGLGGYQRLLHLKGRTGAPEPLYEDLVE
jgi:hypothetical protein